MKSVGAEQGSTAVRANHGAAAAQETIAAISTPPGRGGIGIVRLSGTEARNIAERIVRAERPLEAGRARFVVVLDPDDVGARTPPRVLDEAVVTYFKAPQSYTGEDVVEIAAHGSPVVLESILREMLRQGARLADPGEFTQRAFLAGRLDLTQAEAVHELISATTLHQARVAASQMSGAIAVAVAPAKQRLVDLIALLEAGIDFAEDDLDVAPVGHIELELEQIARPLQRLAASFSYGRILREGFTLAIVGQPNAGKSSLFNALLERDRAIVTATPGTTRDAITERLSFDGIPVEVTDTAGLRESVNEAESLGIARARAHLAEADLVLLVIDLTRELSPEDLAILQRETAPDTEPNQTHQQEQRRLLVVANKVDAFTTKPELDSAMASLCTIAARSVVAVSALTGEGLPALRTAIHTKLTQELPDQDTAIITSLRQHVALTSATNSLAAAHTALRLALPQEILLLDLHSALAALDDLTGATTADDILHRIFSTFCIGK